VPAPCGAMLVLLPLILSFEILPELGIEIDNYLRFMPLYIISIGFLLPSRWPTFSLKNIHIQKEYVWILMLSFGVCALEIFLHPWYMIPIMSSMYIVSMFFSFIQARRIKE
jgi:CDP-diacylglycerol--serine O-phosphatidyltransferase